MKTVFLIASLLFVAQANAFVLLEIEQLPVLQGVSISMTEPGMAAVQPQGLVNFNYASCAARSFDADVTVEAGITVVRIIDKMEVDCFGPTTVRAYTVQFSSDVSGYEPVLVANPQTINTKKPF